MTRFPCYSVIQVIIFRGIVGRLDCHCVGPDQFRSLMNTR